MAGKSNWSPSEHRRLQIAVDGQGKVEKLNWTIVSRQVGSKTSRQCRNHWQQGHWPAEEIASLRRAARNGVPAGSASLYKYLPRRPPCITDRKYKTICRSLADDILVSDSESESEVDRSTQQDTPPLKRVKTHSRIEQGRFIDVERAPQRPPLRGQLTPSPGPSTARQTPRVQWNNKYNHGPENDDDIQSIDIPFTSPVHVSKSHSQPVQVEVSAGQREYSVKRMECARWVIESNSVGPETKKLAECCIQTFLKS